MGQLGQLNSAIVTEEAKRKVTTRKKALATKAAKQKKKALGTGETDDRQAERDKEGASQYLLGQYELADEAEEEVEFAAQASTGAKEAHTSSKISTL